MSLLLLRKSWPDQDWWRHLQRKGWMSQCRLISQALHGCWCTLNCFYYLPCVTYSTGIYFLHQSTGPLAVPGYTNMHTISTQWGKHINDTSSLRIKATFSCEVTRASMPEETGWRSVVRSCIMPGHLVQELNVGTVLKLDSQQTYVRIECWENYEIRISFFVTCMAIVANLWFASCK